MEVEYTVSGMTLLVQWDATTKRRTFGICRGSESSTTANAVAFSCQSAGAPVMGATGKVLFTTKGAAFRLQLHG